MDYRDAIFTDFEDLCQLAKRISISDLPSPAKHSTSFRAQESQLDEIAWELRRTWLKRAHYPADATPKSPSAGQSAQLPSGRNIDFGYERDLDVSELESRHENYMQPKTNWSTDLVLFRSGQSALAALLQFAVSRFGRKGPLALTHVGAYFETTSLLDFWPEGVFERARSRQGADVAIVEPVWCDGQFGCSRESAATPRRALVVDTTMVGASYNVHLEGSCPLVVAVSSGLKLDQAGLELGNVGIVRLYARKDRADACAVAQDLRNLRGLMGTGLTLDELSALSAPWFMDRDYAEKYAGAIFTNNKALARAVGNASPTFKNRCHPSLWNSNANAPFCALQLRDPSPQRYRRMLKVFKREIERRGLLATEGGSFGFRGHRFELIEPPSDQGNAFFRVALGWRDGYSRQGLCTLLEELSDRGVESLDD